MPLGTKHSSTRSENDRVIFPLVVTCIEFAHEVIAHFNRRRFVKGNEAAPVPLPSFFLFLVRIVVYAFVRQPKKRQFTHRCMTHWITQ